MSMRKWSKKIAMLVLSFGMLIGSRVTAFAFVPDDVNSEAATETVQEETAAETPEENLCPSSQLPVPAISASSSPLCPIPEEEEVAKGMTVFPVKSLASTKAFTGHAAFPHHMG